MGNGSLRNEVCTAKIFHEKVEAVIIQIKAVADDEESCNKTWMIPIMCVSAIFVEDTFQ